jgi:hypothetical protein
VASITFELVRAVWFEGGSKAGLLTTVQCSQLQPATGGTFPSGCCLATSCARALIPAPHSAPAECSCSQEEEGKGGHADQTSVDIQTLPSEGAKTGDTGITTHSLVNSVTRPSSVGSVPVRLLARSDLRHRRVAAWRLRTRHSCNRCWRSPRKEWGDSKPDSEML